MKFPRPPKLRRGGLWWEPLLAMVFMLTAFLLVGGLALPYLEAYQADRYAAQGLQTAMLEANKSVVDKALAAETTYIDPQQAALAFSSDFAQILDSGNEGRGWTCMPTSAATGGSNYNDVVIDCAPPSPTPPGTPFQQAIYLEWGYTNQPGSIAIYGQTYPVHWPATWVGAQVPVTVEFFGVSQTTFTEQIGVVEAVAQQSNGG